MEKLAYYIDLLITLCGFDGSNDNTWFAWLMVILSALLVIYAFYFAITKAIWPEEDNKQHIKYQILDDVE